MKLKALTCAAVTALALTTTVSVPAAHARGAEDRAERQDLMSRTEARRALRDYFARKDRKVRISRTWAEGNKLYAKVKTRDGYPLGVYSVDLRNGRVKREAKPR